MKEQILKLRKQGKTYKEIVEIVGCSKSTVSYHCGEGQKEKNLIRTRKHRKNKLIRKVENFKKSRKPLKYFQERVRKFNKVEINSGRTINKNIEANFNYKDVIKKFGLTTVCYLTGKQITLSEDDYELDHIIPISRGGSNNLSNLGILSVEANQSKGGLLNKEFIELCIKVLKHNNYEVNKIRE